MQTELERLSAMTSYRQRGAVKGNRAAGLVGEKLLLRKAFEKG